MNHKATHTICAPYEKAEYHPAQKHVAPPKVPTRIEDYDGCDSDGTKLIGWTSIYMAAVVTIGVLVALAYLRGCM